MAQVIGLIIIETVRIRPVFELLLAAVF